MASDFDKPGIEGTPPAVPAGPGSASKTLPLGGVVVPSLLLLLALGAWIGFGLDALPQLTGAPRLGLAYHQNQLDEQIRVLDESLHALMDELSDVRAPEEEARALAGLGPVPPVLEAPGEGGEGYYAASCVDDAGLARSLVLADLHLDTVLAETRSLKESYSQILSVMETRADAWARIPSIAPVNYVRLSSHYGRRRDPFTGKWKRHEGLDMTAPRGTPIRASAAGVVKRAGRVRGYGLLVEVNHGNGIATRYAHNSRLAVRRGEHVHRGQIIGYVGSTGRASAPHLHYEVLVDGRPVNPEKHIFAGTLTE